MKTFPAGFATEIAKKTGIAPIWIWKLVVNGVTYWISDHARQIASWQGGVTLLPWVSKFGQLREGLEGSLEEIRIADYQLDLLADPDANPNIMTLATGYPLGKDACSLYLWLAGLDPATAPPQELARGFVTDVSLPDQTRVSVSVEDESSRLRHKYLGTKITTATYPNADPDDVGLIIPLVFGTIKNGITRALRAGLLTTLKTAITAGATSCQVARADGITANMVFRIGDEDITVTNVNGDTLTITRAQNATPHEAGDRLLERVTSPFVFAVADHAVGNLAKVLVRAGDIDIDITDQCTRYTGQGGSQYSTYGSRALVTISLAQADNIRNRVAKLKNSLAVVNPTHAHSNTSTANQIASNVGTDYTNGMNGIATVIPEYPYLGEVIQQTTTMQIHWWGGDLNSEVRINGVLVRTGYSSGWYDWSGSTVGDVWASHEAGGGATPYIELVSCSRDLTYAPQGAAVAQESYLTGSVNSVADALIGGRILADVTNTRTAAQVFDDLLALCGTYSATQVVGSLPGSYAVNGEIIDYQTADKVLNQIAFELRSYFRLAAGVPKLIVRPDTLTSARTIAACRVTDDGRRIHSRRKAPLDQVINKISVLYERDWTKPRGADAYRKITDVATDATSITNYGERERPELFQMDFCTDATMAASVRDFYLAKRKNRPMIHTSRVFLDQALLEFADVVTQGFADNVVGEVQQVQFSPGSITDMDVIDLVVEVP
jgi:hypothetical protein